MKAPICIPILAVLLASFMACSRKQAPDTQFNAPGEKTIIHGSLTMGAHARVVLEEMGAREYIPIDTVYCDSTGAFHMEFAAPQLAFYVLRYGESGYITLLLEPGESLQFSGELANPAAYEVSGSQGSELLMKLSRQHKASLDALGAIATRSRALMSSTDYASHKLELDRQFDSVTRHFRDYSLGFIHQNASSPAILVALYNLYGQGLPVFDPQTDLAVYEFVDSALMSSHDQMEAVGLLHAQVAEARQLLNSARADQAIQKGEIAPDFVSSRPDGSTMALSDLRGNYVLLGFWAGWSGPSRDENAILLRAQDRFRNKNFRILQVSLDDHRETWEIGIREGKLEWEHVSDLMRWESPVANIYQVEKIPYHVIIDPVGRVVAADVYGEQLLLTLENILNE